MTSAPFNPNTLSFAVPKPGASIVHLVGLFGERLYRFASAEMRAQGYDVHGIFLGHDEINHPFERYMPYLHIDVAVADVVEHLAGAGDPYPLAYLSEDLGRVHLVRTGKAVRELLFGVNEVYKRTLDAGGYVLLEMRAHANVVWDTSRTDDERRTAAEAFRKLLYARADANDAAFNAAMRRALARIERERVATDLPTRAQQLVEALEAEYRARIDWLTEGAGSPGSAAQRTYMEFLSGYLQGGKRAIRAAATVAAAETSKDYSSYLLRRLHLDGAPVFSRTNGAALLIDGRKRVLMMAPNVRAVRLRVSNPVGSNGGAIELESPPNAGWRQSIGATANDRATLRCDRVAETAATAGDHEIVIRVRNDVGPSECILTVRVADTAPAFPKAAVRARRLTVGTAASIGFDKATGGNGALTYALDAAPEGMAFDAAARTLSGTPGEAQAATTYTCTATDEDGDEATQTVSVVVVAAG